MIKATLKLQIFIFIFLFTEFTFIPQRLTAQSIKQCGSNYLLQQKIEKSPFQETIVEFERWMQLKRGESRQKGLLEDEEVQIPVVIHIIHKGEPIGEGSNVPDKDVHDQIRVLNEDFNRENSDTFNTPPEFLAVAADLNIRFLLAKRDPNNNPATGIVRRNGNQSSWNVLDNESFLNLTSVSRWPTDKYLNIWVTDISNETVGYGELPESTMILGLPFIGYSNALTDGVVVDYEAFGIGERKQRNLRKGRTTTHEIGHYFGLRHTWGDYIGDDYGGCSVDDFCDDTPNSEVENRAVAGLCHIRNFSCGSWDMHENYMDYSADACTNLFTLDQKERVRIVLENSPRRNSLLSSHALTPVGRTANDLGIKSHGGASAVLPW